MDSDATLFTRRILTLFRVKIGRGGEGRGGERRGGEGGGR